MDIEEYIEKAQHIIDLYGILRIIYLRVSTNNKGQDETDQLPDILKAFDLKEEQCIIITAKETAFQENKQESRILNTIINPILQHEDFEDDYKYLYVWDLDRLYRNQERQVDFIRQLSKHDCIVLSYRQKFLHQLKEAHSGVGKAMYNFLIEILAWQSEDESRKKGDRLKKSLKIKENRTYSNKGNLYGRKLVKKIVKGEKIYFTSKELDIIEGLIKKLRNMDKSYKQIQQIFIDKKDLKLSIGYIYNTCNK